MKKKMIITVILVLAGIPSMAQRTMAGSGFAEVSARSTVSWWGTSVSYGQYTMQGRWRVSAAADGRRVGLRSSRNDDLGTLLFGQAGLEGGYMFRLWSTKDRKFSAYGGGGVLLGIESVDPMEERPNGGNIPFEYGNSFVYGPEAGVEVEWYLAGRLALVGAARGSACMGSRMGLFFFDSSAGFRWNF